MQRLCFFAWLAVMSAVLAGDPRLACAQTSVVVPYQHASMAEIGAVIERMQLETSNEARWVLAVRLSDLCGKVDPSEFMPKQSTRWPVS